MSGIDAVSNSKEIVGSQWRSYSQGQRIFCSEMECEPDHGPLCLAFEHPHGLHPPNGTDST
jgi:hypothetical protein